MLHDVKWPRERGKGWSGKISSVMKHRRQSFPEQWKIITESSQEKGENQGKRKTLKFSRLFYRIWYFSTWVNLLGIRNMLDIVDCIQILLGIKHTALNLSCDCVSYTMCAAQSNSLETKAITQFSKIMSNCAVTLNTMPKWGSWSSLF